MLKQDITRKKQVDKIMSRLEFDISKGEDNKYKIEAIHNSAVYASKTKGNLSSQYYLVLWKSYSKVGDFLSIAFLSYPPLFSTRIWRFFTYNYTYAHYILTCLLELVF